MKSMIQDVPYGSAGGETLLLDVHVPMGDGPFPVAIVVHGGGWGSGDKRTDLPFLPTLVDRGWLCFSIDYRLAPRHPWPACHDDVVLAIDWVNSNAGAYNGDVKRLVAVGYSAGGHLAVHAVLAVQRSPVKAVAALAAPTDMVLDSLRRGGLSVAMKGLLGTAEIDGQTLETLWRMSPINHLRAGSPPCLLVHGTDDQSVSFSQSTHFKQRVADLGATCEIISLVGGVHRISEWRRYRPLYDREIEDWLRRKVGDETHAAFYERRDRGCGSWRC